jgi:hypothetical protein
VVWQGPIALCDSNEEEPAAFIHQKICDLGQCAGGSLVPVILSDTLATSAAVVVGLADGVGLSLSAFFGLLFFVGLAGIAKVQTYSYLT